LTCKESSLNQKFILDINSAILHSNCKIQYPKLYNIIETLSIDGQQKNEIDNTRSGMEIWEDFSAAFLGVLTYWSSNDGKFDVEGRT